ESGQTSYFTAAMPVPTMLLSDDATDRALAGLREKIAARESELSAVRDHAHDAFESWLAGRTGRPQIPGLVGSFAFESIGSGKLANDADPANPGHVSDDPMLVEGRHGHGRAAELDGENGFTFPKLGHASRVDPFSISLELRVPARV